jgi:hypothetical protein
VKLVNGRGKSKPIDFGECGMRGDEHASIWLRRAFTLLEKYDKGLVGTPINWVAADESEPPAIETYVKEPTRGQYRTAFLKHSKTPSTRIRFTINYGRTGKVSVGLDPDGPVPLGHIPTGDAYRGILYLPRSGTMGMLAIESVPNAPNPTRMLNNWLARAGFDLALEDVESLEGLDPGETEGAKPQPFKLNFNQYPNIARVEKAVENSQTAKVVLKKQNVDGGATPTDEEVIISSTLRTQPKRQSAARMAGLLVRKAVGKLEDDEEPISLEDLEELVDGDLDGIDWTEGYIQIDDESGLKKIGLEKIDKFFVYPCHSATPLKFNAFEKAVAKELVGLQRVLQLDLDLA